MSEDVLTKVGVFDDGRFVRTALLVEQDSSISFDIVSNDPNNPEGKIILARLNVFYHASRDVTVDVIYLGMDKDMTVKSWDNGAVVLNAPVKSPVAVILKKRE